MAKVIAAAMDAIDDASAMIGARMDSPSTREVGPRCLEASHRIETCSSILGSLRGLRWEHPQGSTVRWLGEAS